MSLTSCIKKAGAFLHPEDKAALIDRVRVLREEGMKADEAARQAIREQTAVVQDLIANPEKAIPKPETKVAESQTKEEGNTQRIAQMALDTPEMKVTIPGHEPMTLSQAMETVKAEAAEDLKQADLVQTALECALTL